MKTSAGRRARLVVVNEREFRFDRIGRRLHLSLPWRHPFPCPLRAEEGSAKIAEMQIVDLGNDNDDLHGEKATLPVLLLLCG